MSYYTRKGFEGIHKDDVGANNDNIFPFNR